MNKTVIIILCCISYTLVYSAAAPKNLKKTECPKWTQKLSQLVGEFAQDEPHEIHGKGHRFKQVLGLKNGMIVTRGSDNHQSAIRIWDIEKRQAQHIPIQGFGVDLLTNSADILAYYYDGYEPEFIHSLNSQKTSPINPNWKKFCASGDGIQATLSDGRHIGLTNNSSKVQLSSHPHTQDLQEIFTSENEHARGMTITDSDTILCITHPWDNWQQSGIIELKEQPDRSWKSSVIAANIQGYARYIAWHNQDTIAIATLHGLICKGKKNPNGAWSFSDITKLDDIRGLAYHPSGKIVSCSERKIIVWPTMYGDEYSEAIHKAMPEKMRELYVPKIKHLERKKIIIPSAEPMSLTQRIKTVFNRPVKNPEHFAKQQLMSRAAALTQKAHSSRLLKKEMKQVIRELHNLTQDNKVLMRYMGAQAYEDVLSSYDEAIRSVPNLSQGEDARSVYKLLGLDTANAVQSSHEALMNHINERKQLAGDDATEVKIIRQLEWFVLTPLSKTYYDAYLEGRLAEECAKQQRRKSTVEKFFLEEIEEPLKAKGYLEAEL